MKNLLQKNFFIAFIMQVIINVETNAGGKDSKHVDRKIPIPSTHRGAQVFLCIKIFSHPLIGCKCIIHVIRIEAFEFMENTWQYP